MEDIVAQHTIRQECREVDDRRYSYPMDKKRIVYLGNRDICYKVIRNNPKYEIVKVLTFPDCALQRFLERERAEYEIITELDNDYVIQLLIDLSYELLIVNGCPFILPASLLKSSGKMLLNTHPTYLPYLRGKAPINGCFLYNYPLGATTYYMSDKIDGGNIIYQEKVDLTPDLDLGLCYFISYTLEERVFRRALEVLEESEYRYVGSEIDTVKYPLFKNGPHLRELDFQKMTAADCVRHVRAYGIEGEGCYANIEGIRYVIYDAEQIVNEYILEKMSPFKEGSVVLEYDSKKLIKCHRGILKLKKYCKI